MTLPHERTRAVVYTEQFLKDLCNSKETPHNVRERAQHLLRHYPSKLDMQQAAMMETPMGLQRRIFGDPFENQV